MTTRLARSMWTVFEPVHAVAYFAPHVREAFEQAGVRGFWRAYFAGRAAPLGRTGAHPVHAAFQGFTLEMVGRALPGVWDLIDPGAAWTLRTEAAGQAIAECAAGLDDAELEQAADLLRSVTGRLDPIGRPFFAAHLDLAWPTGLHEAIWHACTLLREHRGEGYVLSCLVYGASGLEMMVLADRLQATPTGHATANRGWSEEAWGDCVAAMTERGLLSPTGQPTEAGLHLRTRVEQRTDTLASDAWAAAEPEALRTTTRVLSDVAEDIAARGWLTYPNAVGVPRPESLHRH